MLRPKGLLMTTSSAKLTSTVSSYLYEATNASRATWAIGAQLHRSRSNRPPVRSLRLFLPPWPVVTDARRKPLNPRSFQFQLGQKYLLEFAFRYDGLLQIRSRKPLGLLPLCIGRLGNVAGKALSRTIFPGSTSSNSAPTGESGKDNLSLPPIIPSNRAEAV